jgi:hypothetical protein
MRGVRRRRYLSRESRIAWDVDNPVFISALVMLKVSLDAMLPVAHHLLLVAGREVVVGFVADHGFDLALKGVVEEDGAVEIAWKVVNYLQYRLGIMSLPVASVHIFRRRGSSCSTL